MIKNLLFAFVFIPILLLSWDIPTYHELQENYNQGIYDPFLLKLHEQYEGMKNKGEFEALLESKKYSLPSTIEKLNASRENERRLSPQFEELARLQKHLLTEVVQKYPYRYITKVVKDLLHYHEKYDENKIGAHFLVYLEVGAIHAPNDPLVQKAYEICLETNLKHMVITSNLIKGEIDKETADLQMIILEIDKNKHIMELCSQFQGSQAVHFFEQGITVNDAMLQVSIHNKYLDDLLLGMRAPANEQEKQVKKIIRYCKAIKEKILEN